MYKQHDKGIIITQYSVIRKFDGKTIEKGKVETECDDLTPFRCSHDGENAVKLFLEKRYPKAIFDIYATSFTDKGFK